MSKIKMKSVVHIVLLFLTVTRYSSSVLLEHETHRHCSHQHPKADQVVTGVHIEPAHIVKKRSIDQPLRISIFYDESVYRLEDEKFVMINNTILPEAVKFWEQALKVRKTGGPIKLNRKCPSRTVFLRGGRSHCIDTCNAETTCGEVVVPEEHLNPCYVCNRTGHDCKSLPRPRQRIDVAMEIDGNSLNDGTVLPTIPDEIYEEPEGVVDTDFVLYVSAVETERCRRGLTVAYASHCQQESALDRPIAGHANFCPGELSTKNRDLPSVLSTVKHEMLHALGFSVSLFAFYRDDNGEPLTPRRPETGTPALDEELQIHQWSERVVRNITRKDWMVRGGYIERTFQMMVTPRVVKEVRDHFNCSVLEGAELEDQGGEGTALTHWEKRLFENEAMTGTHTQNSVFSRITLAMMEDTGWYRADYSSAHALDWGAGRGCQFAGSSCKQWMNRSKLSNITEDYEDEERKSPAPYCSRIKGNPLRTECSPRRDAVVLCNLVRHDTILPRQYQHFDLLPGVPPGEEAFYGGAVSLADYCPYLQEFSWRHKNTLIRGSTCQHQENTPKGDVNFALENYGAHSKCFDHSTRVWEQKSCRQIREWQHWGSGCYKYKCESGRLHIIVGNYTYTCFHAGQVLQVRIVKKDWLHKGGVVCPPCREMCKAEFDVSIPVGTVCNYTYTCFHAGQVLQVRIVKKDWLHKGGVVCPPCREMCKAEFDVSTPVGTVCNYTYTCFHAGQVLQVRIVKKDWLHKGGVVCPPCREMCKAEFDVSIPVGTVCNYTYTCFHAGQVLQVRIVKKDWLHKGGVVCPPCREMCKAEFDVSIPVGTVCNYTYTCFHAGQVLQVRIVKKDWLHKGGVVCPPCREMCKAEFDARNEYCKPGEEPLPPNLYPNDFLKCSASSTAPAAILFTLAILFYTLQ